MIRNSKFEIYIYQIANDMKGLFPVPCQAMAAHIARVHQPLNPLELLLPDSSSMFQTELAKYKEDHKWSLKQQQAQKEEPQEHWIDRVLESSAGCGLGTLSKPLEPTGQMKMKM